MVIFSQYILQNILKRFINGKIVIDRNSHNKHHKFVTSSLFLWYLGNVCLFPFKWNHSTIHNSNHLKTEGRIPQSLNIMDAPVGRLTIKFNSIIFNSLSLLL